MKIKFDFLGSDHAISIRSKEGKEVTLETASTPRIDGK